MVNRILQDKNFDPDEVHNIFVEVNNPCKYKEEQEYISQAKKLRFDVCGIDDWANQDSLSSFLWLKDPSEPRNAKMISQLADLQRRGKHCLFSVGHAHYSALYDGLVKKEKIGVLFFDVTLDENVLMAAETWRNPFLKRLHKDGAFDGKVITAKNLTQRKNAIVTFKDAVSEYAMKSFDDDNLSLLDTNPSHVEVLNWHSSTSTFFAVRDGRYEVHALTPRRKGDARQREEMENLCSRIGTRVKKRFFASEEHFVIPSTNCEPTRSKIYELDSR